MRASAWSGLSSGTLGDLAFLEGPQIDSLVFFYADGTECELWLASPRRLDQLQCGTYRMLIDTPGILAGALFPEHVPTDAEQTDQLWLLLASLGHEMSHFLMVMARGQLWWAYGQMEELRRYCMNLARLREGFLAELEGHEKVDQVLPAEALAPLAAICCLLERDAMLRAGSRLVHYYLELARPLVAAQGVACPAKRERVMRDRMERLLLPAR